MTDNKKWQPLEIKLKRGVPFEEACVEAGIDLEEAKEHLNSKKELEKDQDNADSLWFRDCIKIALTELQVIIKECPDPECRRRASKDILDFYRDERRRLEGGGKKDANKAFQDIFDQALRDSPWNFANE